VSGNRRAARFGVKLKIMQPLPHHYTVSASAEVEGAVALASAGLTDISSAGPIEFGGPGDLWSPETLLTAALVDCFVLSFRAVARASHFEWLRLDCDAVGTLDRVDKATQFTVFTVKAVLTVPAGSDVDRARKLLEKSEHVCLISNSLKAEKHLEVEIRVAA